jgi:phosphoethanolamine N-methyltransferase
VGAEDSHYTDEFIDRLETLWGEGFLSPGGPEEVEEIVKGVDLAGKSVLDIGCGTGGAEIVLAAGLEGGRLTAIDVEEKMTTRTRKRVADAGLADKIDVQLVAPGPLDFPDASFDVVFSKDAMVHIPDKAALFHDVLRVLRPGGLFTASDWLVGENADTSPEWARFCELAHLDFHFVTSGEMEMAMRDAGFERVSTIDRNAWYAPLTVREVEQLEGPLRDRIIEVSDEATHKRWLKMRRALRDSVGVGALRPTHLRGFKVSP